MSLLLDALRRAEAAKKKGVQPAAETNRDTAALPTLDLVPPDTTEPATVITEPARELSLAEEAGLDTPTPTPAPAPLSLELEPAIEKPVPATMVEPVLAVESVIEPAVVSRAEPAPSPTPKPVETTPPPEPPVRPAAAAFESPKPPPAPRQVPPELDRRAAAKRVLSAGKPAKAPVNRTLMLAVAGVVAVLGCAGYLWWEMQPPGSIKLFGSDSPPPPPAESSPTGPVSEAPAPPAEGGVPPAEGTAAPQEGVAGVHPPLPPGPSPADAAGTAPPIATTSPAQPIPVPSSGQPKAAPEVPSRPDAPTAPARVRAPAPAPSGIQFARNAADDAIDPSVTNGYRAYQAGNLAAAGAAYRQALSRDPRNRDALLGLAAVALRSGDQGEAERHYRELLSLDPQDNDARSGLLAASRSLQPVERETQLVTLLATQPGSAQLAQELGALYGSQQRWTEAQQQYFRAYSLDPSNPDAAYNLAISLERVDQPKLALDHYRKALTLAAQRPPRFDPQQVQRRIQALSPAEAGASQ